MTSLKARIVALIEVQGPISVAQFMALALHDPQSGYYATRDPFGAAGDFITAPEISQMFGEMLGLWVVQAWADQGSPKNPRLAELGPGRGTLMADMLRAMRVAPLGKPDVTLVEASPVLRDIQRQKLKDADAHISWQNQLDAVPGRPLFVVANEFFDALPIRQYVKTPRGWCERMVTTANGELAFALAPTPAPGALIPENRAGAPEGGVYETAPSAIALAEDIARQVATQGGGALFLDYGYDAVGFAETLQAVGGHAFADVLLSPGEDDLSAHVDFAALAAAGARGGASVHGPLGQGEFLTTLGIAQRAEKLMAANPASATAVYDALERLIAPDKMGTLFKAMAFLPPARHKCAGLCIMKRLTATNLEKLPGIAHGFLGRDGGVSTGLYASLNCGPGSKDNSGAVTENRRRVAAALLADARLASLAQIHSPFVHVVDAAWDCAAHPQGDGMATATPGIALGILTADCAPVLFADTQARVIGAAHAGWKGALGGVLEATLAAMRSLGARDITAAIGPCISAANYEVGGDFRDRFLEAAKDNACFFGKGRDGHFHFDLPAYVAARLAGLELASVARLDVCTYPAQNDFFSFRRATHAGEPDYGRENFGHCVESLIRGPCVGCETGPRRLQARD